MKALVAGWATVVLAASCSQSDYKSSVAVPKDGVHITGAVNIVYRPDGGGSCALNSNGAVRFLAYSDDVAIGAPTLSFGVAPYTGNGRYDRFGGQVPIPMSLWVGLRGTKQWVAATGVITVDRVSGRQASGTVQAAGLREMNDHSKVDAIGSWRCQVNDLLASPSPSPPPSPTEVITPAPLPVGTAVARRILPPATVLPVRALCTTPLAHDADGNADPLRCRDGSVNVDAWQYFAAIDSHVMALGPDANADTLKAAIDADFGNHSTNEIEYSGYALAVAYYGWTFTFDYWQYVVGGRGGA
jgi:hypothetical protein